jgi:hypothetical protein
MTDKPTNFITRHITSLRELASSMREAPGLAEVLNKSANIIEQVVDGNATLRADHERQLTELRTQIYVLEVQLTATHQRVADLSGGALELDPAWHNLPCSPLDLNALAQLMPSGWVEVEWETETSAFVIMNAWGVTPAVLEDYDWQSFIVTDPGPGLHPKRPEDCFEAWPHGRRCFAEYAHIEGDEGDSSFRLLAINDQLVYHDPDGTPEPATFFFCTTCDANFGAADPEPHDHCPICHKDGTLLLMREDGVRVP